MKTIKLLILTLSLFLITQSNAQVIDTYAGNGTAGYSGDGGQATAAEIYGPTGIGSDASGNIYIADTHNNRIRKVSTSGIITTYGGNGTAGFSGDGGQATAAEINTPRGITVDASGNVYFIDLNNQRVREINTSGIIHTVAGNGVAGFSGDGGQATAAELHGPLGLFKDGSGNIYIADAANNRIRKINGSGVISTFAGNGMAGFSGDGGQATAASLHGPNDVGIDASGNIYITDIMNERVREINTSSGIINTVAGNGTAGFSGDGGQATAAELNHPSSVKVAGNGDIYINDNVNNRVREVNTSGVISTVAGNGTAGFSGDGGQATAAEIHSPAMFVFDPSGNYYIADNGNNRIRVIYLSLKVTDSVLSNVSCHGGSNGSAEVTSITHGTSPYSYSWTGGGTSSSYTGLTAGSYTVTVTDANSITGTASVTITQPAYALSVTALATDTALCPGVWDSLKSTPSGGTTPYTYSWLPAPVGDMGCNTCQNTTVMPYGTNYTITVTDSHGCTVTASQHITVYPYPYTTIIGPLNPVCGGNSDTLVASGGTTYTWSTGATTSSIIVSPTVNTTYTLEASNSYGCTDSAQYVIDTSCVGNGDSSASPIKVVPTTSGSSASYSSLDSVMWFSFTPTDSNTQIVAISYPIGIPVPHVHRLTLYDSAMNTLEDKLMADIQGAMEIRIDASHLKVGKKYLVRAARTPAYINTPGCNPSTNHECNDSLRWSFQMAFRTVPVFIPDDSGSEAHAVSHVYFENRGQIEDQNGIPRFDIKAYTNYTSPALCLSDSIISFVLESGDTVTNDSIQRVDMEPTGSYAQTPQRLFNMELDSVAGYLNYYKEFIPNGVINDYGYARVIYKDVFPKIDMQVYSNNNGAKFYFVCAAVSGGASGGNPSNIELQFKGASSINITSDSGLEISTDIGNITFAPGEAYEDSAGVIVPTSWHANFEKVSANVVRFHTGSYNTNEPLVIRVDRGHPPTVSSLTGIQWSTYMGGIGDDWFNDVTNYDPNNVVAAGVTNSYNFPAVYGFQSNLNQYDDAIIVCFDPGSTDVNWSTYYGGSKYDWANGVVNDRGPSSNIYVTGFTRSTDFPFPISEPPHAYVQKTLNNDNSDNADCDAFVVEFNPSGHPIWTTYYGGNNGGLGSGEIGNHIALDQNDQVYVVGSFDTYKNPVGTGFPTKYEIGAYNSAVGTGFILKFNSDDSLVWATNIGDQIKTASSGGLFGCTVDQTYGDLYVTGHMDSAGYPVLYPAGNATTPYKYGPAGVMTVFSGWDNSILWSTYYGGDYETYGTSVTLRDDHKPIFTGYTSSPYTTDIPLTNPGGHPITKALTAMVIH